jgi:transcriptional regulator with GAF, ATPase, and Fis domain/HAMP domain-containing protein
LLIAFFINNLIAKPIIKLTEVVDCLGRGEVPESVDYEKDNEIGDILKSVNNLTEGIKSYTSFATSVGEGELSTEFEKLGVNDVLGTSLIDMRDNLQKISEEERKRSWSTEGLAQFATILRQEEDIVKLSQSIVSSLVKYVRGNQAGLFVAYGEGEEEYLELKATYAYDREKFEEKSIKKGQGLVGQCWHEGEYIYMTDMPNNYINIGSGLGDANPNCLLIVPLVYNDLILGVIEIASFNEFTENEIEFILKLGESIAATISAAKVNESTSNLLSETNEMTEQLQSQEEELRQQTEELLATQEENERRYQVLEKDFKLLKKEKTALEKTN